MASHHSRPQDRGPTVGAVQRFFFISTVLLRLIIVNGDWSFSSIFQPLVNLLPDTELCSDSYISPNFHILEENFERKLFGQPFVSKELLAIWKYHFLHEPKKSLVISLNGWTGGGKNYVTTMLMESLYSKGMKSKFVHLFNGRLHFPLNDDSSLTTYRTNLQQWIMGNVSACPRSTFIFDEVDRVPSKVMDGIKPFLEYYDFIDGINFRRAIFIFLTNQGGGTIVEKYIELWKSGVPRDQMRYKEFEPLVRSTLYNSDGPFSKSSILGNHLVSIYVPFLPLEKDHVRSCIREEMRRQMREPDEDDVEQVLKTMEFYKDRYSTFGCKRVIDQVAFLFFKHMEF